MTLKTAKVFYWTSFGLSVTILLLNFGLGLIAMRLVILPVLILHFAIGLGLDQIVDQKSAVILSAINLLLFALIRPEGVHAFTDNGLSSSLDFLGINAGYSYNYEDYFFIGGLVLLLVQAVMDIRLWKMAK